MAPARGLEGARIAHRTGVENEDVNSRGSSSKGLKTSFSRQDNQTRNGTCSCEPGATGPIGVLGRKRDRLEQRRSVRSPQLHIARIGAWALLHRV